MFLAISAKLPTGEWALFLMNCQKYRKRAGLIRAICKAHAQTFTFNLSLVPKTCFFKMVIMIKPHKGSVLFYGYKPSVFESMCWKEQGGSRKGSLGQRLGGVDWSVGQA